ncbi:MAG TPA: glycosyltransferase family 1 protein [Blastocatellia bacterium]|nr:glycosyltransferase family 1 protein [Blastocatellia bacterium]
MENQVFFISRFSIQARMHIGIDAHAIGARQGGNETYIRNLLVALAELDQANQYTLYFSEAQAADAWRNRYANFQVRLLPPPTPLVRVPLALAFDLRRYPVDVLHVQYTAPPFCPVPVVTTIHDLAFEHLPETFTRRGKTQLRLTVRRTARRAAHILTVSEYSRQDIIRTYGLSPDKITVTHNGCEVQYTPQPASSREAEEIRRKFGITQDYLLAVGSLQPRKNLIRLLRAYVALRQQHPDFQPQLVLVGRRLWLYEEVLREIRQQPFAADVIVTGYANEEDLPALYRSAIALVYPSLFEGFGLPPLEAMACGTPVITSNSSSLPEVVGDAALLVNPYEEAALSQAMWQIANDAALRLRLRQAGIKQAKQFTWHAAAEKTLAVYRAVAHQRQLS